MALADKTAAGKKPAARSSFPEAPAKEAAPGSPAAADVSDEPRIGVFVCRCGTNMAGFLDVEGATEYAGILPGVVFATRNLYICAEDGVSAVKDAIKEHGLNRVAAASCTPPHTREPLFRDACEGAGLNKCLFEFANIRDHCSWVHMHEWDEATAKARDLVRISVMRAALLQPLEEISIDIHPASMVVGAGITGMTAALSIADRGFGVFVVEKEAEVGDAVVINCVGSRSQRVSYCNRICCMADIKNAIALEESCPEANISILHNDIEVLRRHPGGVVREGARHGGALPQVRPRAQARGLRRRRQAQGQHVHGADA